MNILSITLWIAVGQYSFHNEAQEKQCSYNKAPEEQHVLQ